MKAIPAQRLESREITHTSTLSGGFELRVSLTCVFEISELPFGSDRQLLRWLCRRAVRTRELGVSSETLLEYLGANLLAVQQQDLFLAAERLGSVLVSCRTGEDELRSFSLVKRQSFDRQATCTAQDGRIFQGRTHLELAGEFIDLAGRVTAL